MQVKGKARWMKGLSLAAVAALLTIALFSWGQLGRTPQNLQSRGRLPSRQQLQNLEIVSKLSAEYINTLAVRGQYVYASGMGTLIAVYDISDPQNIRKVGELPFNLPEGQYGHVEKLEVIGNHAYAQTIIESGIGYTISLKIIDISNPTNPRQVGEYSPAGVRVNGFVLGNNYAYVQVSGSKLHVLNISNPASPQFVREISDVPALEGDGGVVVGNRLYLVHGLAGVSIWDISQPDNPQKLGTVDTPGVARSIAVSGNYAYVADGMWSTPGAEQGYLRVVNVSDPSNPQIVNSVATAGNNPWFPMALVGNALYLSDLERGVTQIFDITNPTSPTSVGTIEGMLAGFDASSNRIVTLRFGTDFVVWDITNRTAPNRLARYSGLSPSVTALKDEYLITTTRTGLIVFNTSNPARLQKVSQVALPDLPSHYGIRLVLAGDLAVVSHSNYTAGPKIYFVNFTNPTSPQLLGTDNLGQTTSVHDIEVIKDLYLLVGHTYGCEIFDLTTRTRVGSVGGIYGSVLGVAGQGDVVCLVQSLAQSSILKVFDATDPLNMSFRGEISFDEGVSDIEMVGSLVFIATQKANLLVFDVSDPSSPRQVASWANPNAPQYDIQVRITVSGSFAYLAVSQYENGLIVLDLSNLPNTINKVASFTGRSCDHASVQGNLIYLAAADGLYVLRQAVQAQFIVFGVIPSQVPPFGQAEIVVVGNGFQDGATFWLERNGETIVPTNITFVSSQRLTGVVNLEGKPDGSVWDVVVRNPDGQEARNPRAFLVTATPTITAVEPSTVYPRTEVLNIRGSGFMDGVTVVFKPPTGSGVPEIAAQSIQRQDHTQLQVNFDFSPIRSYFNDNPYAEQLLGALTVTNPNGKKAEATLRVLRPISVTRIEPSDIVAEPGQPLVLTLRGSFVVDEPLQVKLVRSTTTLTAETQVLSSSEAKATFTAPMEQLIGHWTLEASQLGFTSSRSIYVREFMAVVYNTLPQTVAVDRPDAPIVLDFKVTDVGAGLQVKIKRATKEITANTVEVSEYVIGYSVKATFNFTLTSDDFGAWDLVLTRPDGKSRTYPQAVTLTPNISVERVDLNTRHTQFDLIEVTIKGKWLVEGTKVILVPPGWARTYLSEINPLDISYSQDGTEIKAVFSVFDKVAPAWFGWLLQNFNIPVEVRALPIAGRPLSRTVSLETPSLIADFIGPSRIRAGREEAYRLTINNHSNLPDTPFLILNFQVEPSEEVEIHYRVVDMGREVRKGVWKPGQTEPGFPLLPHRGWALGVYPGWRTHSIFVRVVPKDTSATQEFTLRVSATVVSSNFLVAFVAQQAREMGLGRSRSSSRIFQFLLPRSVLIHAIKTELAAIEAEDPFAFPADFDYDRAANAIADAFLSQANVWRELKKEAVDFALSQAGTAALKHLLMTKLNLPEDVAEEGAGILYGVAKGDKPEDIALSWLMSKVASVSGLGLTLEILQRLTNVAIRTGVVPYLKASEYARSLTAQNLHELAAQQSSVVRSWDPNAKDGSFGIDGFISGNQFITYNLLFENLESATAPAEEVLLEDVLDPNLDLETLSFTQFGFGNHVVSLPEGTRELNHEVNVRSDLVVQVRSSLDPQTRKLTVTFKGVDPNTGQHHPDGFLPPNRNQPEGEGFVTFQIRPKADAPSGSTIKNKATITFDPHLGVNPPMTTNEHVITLDTQAPQVQVTTMPEAPTARFPVNWTGSDDASGIREVEVWVSDDGKPYSLWKVLNPSLSQRIEGSETFIGKFGHEYRFYPVVVDRVGNRSVVPSEPQATTKVGKPPRLPSGLRMVTLPVVSEIPDPKQVFGFEENKWAWYDPTTKQYVIYPAAPAFALQVGKGFWARFAQEVTPNAKGDLPDDTQPFAIALKGGSWNQIGNPWLSDLVWDTNEIKVQVGNQTKPLKDARGIVELYAWRWDGSNYQLVFDQNILPNVDNKIPAWEGAWVYAWQDCNLIVPAPQGSRSRQGRMAREKPEGWFAKLVAQIGEEKGQGLFGIAPRTRLQISQPPSPPERQNDGKVQVLFLDKESNTSIADIKTAIGQRQEWDVVVRFGTRDGGRGTRQEEVTLTWDGIGYAPKDVNLTLVDLATGTRRYMRTQTAYRFVPNEGETERRFKVIAEFGNERPLRIVGLKAIPMRGQGVILEFGLTKAANVTAEVLTLTGRKVTVLEVQTPRSSGTHRIVWHGLNKEGVKVSSSVYLIRLIATDEEGRQVQASAPVRLR